MHYAAAWGKVQCLKILMELGSDLQMKTSHGERAREIALRYNQSECVDYLDWAGLSFSFGKVYIKICCVPDRHKNVN